MSRTLLAHIAHHPADERHIVNLVPAKILNQYIYLNRGLSVRAVKCWLEQNPSWPERLRQAASEPKRLARTASAMADAVGREEID